MAEDTQSPTVLIHELSSGVIRSQALYAAAMLGVADFICERSSVTVAN